MQDVVMERWKWIVQMHRFSFGRCLWEHLRTRRLDASSLFYEELGVFERIKRIPFWLEYTLDLEFIFSARYLLFSILLPVIITYLLPVTCLFDKTEALNHLILIFYKISKLMKEFDK